MRTRMDGIRHKQRNISSAYLCIYYDDLNRLYMKTDARVRLYIKQRSQSSVHSYETS